MQRPVSVQHENTPPSQFAGRSLHSYPGNNSRGQPNPASSMHCQYRGTTCYNTRDVKIDGTPHTMCAMHRQAANQNQRKFDKRRADQRKKKTQHGAQPPTLSSLRVGDGPSSSFHRLTPTSRNPELFASFALSEVSDDSLEACLEMVADDGYPGGEMDFDQLSPHSGPQAWAQ